MRTKSCPFCGGEVEVRLDSVMDGNCHYYDWLIRCKSCPAQMNVAADNYYGRDSYTEEQAIEFWNKRY